MTEQFASMLDGERSVSASRALTLYSGAEPENEAPAHRPFANAAFLVTLIAVRARAETSRQKRRAAPAAALDRYRASEALGDGPISIPLRSL